MKLKVANILAMISILIFIGGFIRAYSLQEAQINFDHQKIIVNQQDIEQIKKLLNEDRGLIHKYGEYYG